MVERQCRSYGRDCRCRCLLPEFAAGRIMPKALLMNPETQRRDLLAAGVPERNIHAGIDVSGVAGVAIRNAWRSVDAKFEHGDVLVVATLDRIGRRSLDVMGKIY